MPVLILRPSDIDTSDFTGNESTGDMIRKFRYAIVSSIADKISSTSSAWLSTDIQVLHSDAVTHGRRSPEFASKMGRFFLAAAKPILGLDINEALPYLTETVRKDVEKALARILNKKSFYFLLDDTDQIGSPDLPGHLNRIWSLLLAIRMLSSEINALRAVVTLRAEVWERLKSESSGQRDQVDHFTPLIATMPASKETVGKIVDRRLDLAAEKLGRSGQRYDVFFEGTVASAPYSREKRTWRDLILVRSRERPRDAIQLVNQLAVRARSDGKKRIDENTFLREMPIFSEKVANHFVQEVSLELPAAAEVLRALASMQFDQGSFTLSSDAMKRELYRMMSRFSVKLNGVTLSQDRDVDIFSLWRFLYIAGVLNARVSDKTQHDGYAHLDPLRDPILVSGARWNDMQSVLWEINTAYRDYLISLQDESGRRTGLAHKTPSKKGRR